MAWASGSAGVDGVHRQPQRQAHAGLARHAPTATPTAMPPQIPRPPSQM